MTPKLKNDKVIENMMVEQIIDGHPFFEDVIEKKGTLPPEIEIMIDDVNKK